MNRFRLTARLAGFLLAVAAFAGTPASGQQAPPTPPDTVTRTPTERALERLRRLNPVAAPDTAVQDTVSADSLARAGRPQRLQSSMERDSVMDALLRLSGYVATEYAGREARFEADSNQLILRGAAQVTRQGTTLVADSSIVYNETLGRACGYGNPVVQSAEMANPLASDTVCYLIESGRAIARNARTQVDQGASWLVRGDLYMVGDNYYSHDAIFTDCNEEEPHYHFGAGSLKVVRGNIMVARDVTLNFADVPVFWLPFMVQSMTRGRRSGILMPRFGINDIARTSARYNRRVEDVGFYWAISDHFGAEVAMDWFSQNWTALRGSLDYRFTRQFLDGSVTFKRFWPSNDAPREFTVASFNRWRPNERTNIGLNVDYATSSDFVKRRTFDPNELNATVRSDASFRRQFDFASMSLGAQRVQRLHDGSVEMMLPNLSMTFSPVTLFAAQPGEERWYSDATWTGDLSASNNERTTGTDNVNPQAQDSRTVTARANNTFRLGNLSWQQSANVTDDDRFERILPDSAATVVEGRSSRRGGWSTSLRFTQNLIGTSSFSPGVSIRTDFLRDERTGGRTISAPMRADMNASLSLDLFGFYPGVGTFERFRHRLSPSFTYNYSPAAEADSLQRLVFAGDGVQERNSFSLSLSQTFEGKYRSTRTAEEVAADSIARADSLAATDPQGPRRPPETNTIILLSLSTSAVSYDFVRARDGYGFNETTLTNNITSDLLRGLQMSVSHDLFRQPPAGEDGVVADREFAPHLSSVSASLSVNSNSWLFRVLGLGRGTPQREGEAPAIQEEDPLQAGPAIDRTRPDNGLIGTTRRNMDMSSPMGRSGDWNADLRYSLVRPREGVTAQREEQLIDGTVMFQPTPNWSVRWQTGYSFTASEFSSHILTLTRRLHDWDANFDFVKAQNGNFAMQFRVHLRANPDIKLDYSQQDVQGLRNVR